MSQINFLDFSPETRSIRYENNGKPFPAVTLGAGSYLVSANYENIKYRNHILIGKFCALAHNLKFNLGLNHNYKNVTTYPFDATDFKQIKAYSEGNKLPVWKKSAPQHRQIIIGNDVWIGSDAAIMGGVIIGNGAVIGANAVVAKNIPPYAIAVGNPARVIKYRFDPEIIEKLQKIQWWNWNLDKLRRNIPLMEDVYKFVEKHYSKKYEWGGVQIHQFKKNLSKAGKFINALQILERNTHFGKEF